MPCSMKIYMVMYSHYNIFCQEKEEFSENFNLNKNAYKKAMLVKD